MDIKIQSRIDGYFEKLTEFINKLPLSDKGKNYIWFVSFCQFYDEPVLSENGKTTYGIQTEWQLQRFIEQFKNNFQKLRLKAVQKWTDELNRIEPSEAVAKIEKQLYKLGKKELLAEIGADDLNDWDRWLQKYLSNEIDYQQKKPTRKPPKQQKKTSYVWQNNPDKELPELYNLMVDNYKLIASETTFEQFKAVFTGQKIDDKFVPIKWHDDTASEVGYFLMRLIETNNIIISSRNKFIILNHCFIKNNGSQFDVHWKQINQNLIINLSKEKQKRIDDLISDF